MHPEITEFKSESTKNNPLPQGANALKEKTQLSTSRLNTAAPFVQVGKIFLP